MEQPHQINLQHLLNRIEALEAQRRGSAGRFIAPDELYTSAGIAKDGCHSVSYLDKAASKGDGPPYAQPGGPGTPRIYSGRDYLDWLAQSKISGTHEAAIQSRAQSHAARDHHANPRNETGRELRARRNAPKASARAANHTNP